MFQYDWSFLDDLEFKSVVKDSTATVFVSGMEVLVSSDTDDEDQVFINAIKNGREIYSVWCGKDEMEESFNEVLEEILAL